MTNSKLVFDRNMLVIKDSVSLYKYLEKNAKNFDSAILLRSQFVLIVSAFDTYVHTAIIDRIVSAYFSETHDFDINIEIPLALAFEMESCDDLIQKKGKLLLFLRKTLSKDSFQSPTSIEYAFSIIGKKKIWTFLERDGGKKAEDIRNQLALFVKRRNKIAHESDWNASTEEYEKIDLQTVLNCMEFFNEVVSKLDEMFV
ncbi:MAG: hypothetical protein K2H73_06040 [Treponemataceae bacterium]|nr:hypothetical protein [Treponemataceae bacterium]